LAGLEDHHQALIQHLRQLTEGAPLDNLHLATRMDGRTRPVDELRKAVEAIGGVKLVILDTLAAFARISDLSNYAEVQPVMADIGGLAKESGVHIALVHHSRKREGGTATDKALGSTAIIGGCDTPVVLSVEAKGPRAIVCDSARYGRGLKKTFLDFNPDTGLISVAGAVEEVRSVAAETKLNGMRNDLLTYISNVSDPDRDSVLSSVPGNRSRKQKVLDQLVDDGVVLKTGNGRRGDPFKYFLPNNTSQEATGWKQ
jgi:hypothetical protein